MRRQLFLTACILVFITLFLTAILKSFNLNENILETIRQRIPDVIKDLPWKLPMPATEKANNCSTNKDQPAWMNSRAGDMSAEDLMEYLAWTNSSSCRLAHDFGGAMFNAPPHGYDGQKTLCILPESIAPTFKACVVYSFGISNEWSFDDAIEQVYGCEIYAFDPSMKGAEEKYDRSQHIHFYKIGLGDQNMTSPKGWKLQTLGTIRKMLGHEKRVIDYLKIDIEEAEWNVLAEMIETREFDLVKQIGLEIHLPCCETPLREYQELAGILRAMERYFGMVRFNSEPNPWMKINLTSLGIRELMYANYEMAWYNSKFLI